MKEWLKRNGIVVFIVVVFAALLVFVVTDMSNKGYAVGSVEGIRIVLPDSKVPDQISFNVELKDIEVKNIASRFSYPKEESFPQIKYWSFSVDAVVGCECGHILLVKTPIHNNEVAFTCSECGKTYRFEVKQKGI